MSIGIGIALNNARGCVEALFGHESAFVRTPKYNLDTTDGGQDQRPMRQRVIATPSIKLWMGLLEVAMFHPQRTHSHKVQHSFHA